MGERAKEPKHYEDELIEISTAFQDAFNADDSVEVEILCKDLFSRRLFRPLHRANFETLDGGEHLKERLESALY